MATAVSANTPAPEKRRAVLLFDTGSESDRQLIRDFRSYAYGEVDIIVVATVPHGWNQDLSALDDPAYPNTANPWLFDSKGTNRARSRINHLILAEEDEEGHCPSIKKIAAAIQELDVEVRGILPNPLQAWNEVAIAKLAKELGLRHASVKAVETCLDKKKFNDLLGKMKKTHGMEELLIPQEIICKSDNPIERQQEILEAIGKLGNPLEVAKYNIIHALDGIHTDADITKSALQTLEDAQQTLRRLRKAYSAGVETSKADYRVVLKPADGNNGGSIGVRIINSTDDPALKEFNVMEHLRQQRQIGSTISTVQEFVEGVEVGYHGIKNGPYIQHDLTIKKMTPPPDCKELAHYIPGREDPEYADYQRYRDVVFPVMEALFEELGIDLSHLNADIKITPEGKLCIMDAQLRSGLGVPKLLNAAYQPHDISRQRMFLGMDVFRNKEEGVWTPDWSKDCLDRHQERGPGFSAIVETLDPSAGFLLEHITDAKLAVARQLGNSFHISLPETAKQGTHLARLQTFLSAGARAQVGAAGYTLADARTRIDKTARILGLGMLRLENAELNADYQTVLRLLKSDRLEKTAHGFRSKGSASFTERENAAIATVMEQLVENAGIGTHGNLQEEIDRCMREVPKEYSREERTVARWDGIDPPPHTFVRHNSADAALPPSERWHTTRPPTLRSNGRWQEKVQSPLVTDRTRTVTMAP